MIIMPGGAVFSFIAMAKQTVGNFSLPIDSYAQDVAVFNDILISAVIINESVSFIRVSVLIVFIYSKI